MFIVMKEHETQCKGAAYDVLFIQQWSSIAKRNRIFQALVTLAILLREINSLLVLVLWTWLSFHIKHEKWAFKKNIKSYPWTAEATESMWVGVVPVVQLDVVITTVSFLLYLKRNEAQLDAVALFGRQQPLAVCVTRVIIVSKLRVRVKVLLTSFCFQTTSTLCRNTWSVKRYILICKIRHLLDFVLAQIVNKLLLDLMNDFHRVCAVVNH